jgi:hypothetical protein
LKEHFPDRILVITGSIGKQHLEEINTNFDAAYPKAKQRIDYDVLLATDKLSEGFNLNRQRW